MPKLTINSVCPKGPVYPIIFNFLNGYPSEDFECKCAIIQDDKGKKTIATECGRILYVGVEDTENMGQTLLLVRNRKTGKVRLLETGSVDLKPIINNPKQQFTASNSERIQKLQDLETRNSEPTTSPNPQEPNSTQYLENVSGLSIMPNDYEETHQLSNIIVKPLQYLKTTVIGSNTNLKPQQLKRNKLKANTALNSQQETCPNNITGRRSISYNSKPVNLNFKRRSNSEPSKKGSTTVFSPKRSEHFRHLYNFVVDEIGTIPNQQSETECNKIPKSVNHSIKLIRNKELLSDLLEEEGNDAGTEGMSSKNITVTANISTDNLNEGNKHISSIHISEEIEKVTNISSENIKFTADVDTEELNKVNKILSKELKNKLEEKVTIMETEELAAKKRNFTIDIDPEELQISEIIANKELPRHEEEKSSDIVTQGKEPENTKLTLVVGTEELNKSNKMTSSKLLLRNILEEKVPDLIIEAIASENKLTFDVGTEELEEAHNTIANQEKESKEPPEDVETEGITAEEINSAMDMELLIFSFDALSINTTSEFEGENNLKSKLHQEGHEEHSKWKRKSYLTKQYFVAAMRLDTKDEKKMKQNPDLPASSVGLTNGRTTNDSISSNHAENTYICDYCHAVFKNKGLLIFHLTSHEFSMESNNDVTQLNIKRILETDVQVIDISSENTYICNYCGILFEKKVALVFHLTSHEFVRATNNVTQLRIKRMKGNYNVNNEELNENKHACSNNSSTTIEENENTVLKEENSEFRDCENIKRNNQINVGQTVTEITYICCYCEAVFENKGSLIFHLISHKYIKDADNITQTKVKRVKENDNDDNGNENTCSENYGNTQKQKKIKPDLNEKSKELEDGVNRKRKITGTTHKTTKKELKNNEHGKRTKAANSVTGMGNGTLKVTQDGAIKLINCKHCDYKTDDTSNILKHVLSHTRDNSNQCDPIYICNDCGKEFKSKASLIIHKNNKKKNSNRHKIIRNLCVTCNSSFTTQSDLINHLTKSHKITKPYRCNLCNFKSSSAHELTIHTQTHKTKPFRCAICKYQCHKDNFVQHMESHTDTKPFQCELCDSKFTKKSGLKQHMVTHTGEKEHKCKICDSKFSLLSGLNRHSLIHLKEKPFKCATCSAGFNDKSALKRHQKIHTGEKPYKCAHCEYSCITGNDLKRHIKTHDSKLKQDSSNLKHDSDITEPYQCTRCDSKFSLKNTLICHMKIHTGEKTHKCTFCNKTFIHFSGLKRHLNVHTKNKPVKCTTCNTSYDNETALKWHLRRSKKHQ